MAVNLDDILSRYLPNRNPSTQLHAYVKKLNRPPLWVYNKMTPEEKTDWFDKRKQFFEEVLVRCDLNAMVKNLMRNDYYTTYDMELVRIEPGNGHKKKFNLSSEKKIPFEKSELEEIISKILHSISDVNPSYDVPSNLQINEIKKI